MKKIMEVQIGGIKCDAVGCGFRDDGVKFSEYSHYVGMPCPNCGANLLTQEAHDHAMKYIKMATFLNKWFGWMGRDDGTYDAVITPQYDNKGMPDGVKVKKL